MSFAERLLRRRTPLSDITGFAGGNLQDQIDEENQRLPPDRMSGIQSPQAPPQTMADRYMAQAQPVADTVSQPDDRQRQVNPFQQRLLSNRPRVAEPVGFDVEKLRDLQSQKDPRWEKILNATAAGITSAAHGGAPIQPIPTRRERDIAKTQGQLGQDIAVDKERILKEQGQMVPYTLPDGTTTMVPAKSAATLAVRQQGQQSTLSERKRMNDAHIARWSGMGAHEAAQDAQRLLNSGAADDNDDLKDEIVRRLGLPTGTKLPNHDKGQVQTDAQGNLIIVNPKTADARNVTRPTEPPQPLTANPADATRSRTATAPVQSFKVTQENKRDERARLGRAAAMERALVMARVQNARMGDPSEYESLATQADRDAADAEAQAKEVGPRRAAPYLAEASKAKARAVQLKELAIKAKGGQSVGGSTQAPARQFNERAFRAAFQTKHGRPPTDAEIAPYRNAQP